MMQPGRKYSNGSEYRYGFNGKENDNEVKGEGNLQDYGMRIYDPRLGKFLSVDPITKEYPELTPYQFASNTPMQATDLDGLEADFVNQRTGQRVAGPIYADNYPASQGWVANGAVMYAPKITLPTINTTLSIPMREREIMVWNPYRGQAQIGRESVVMENIAIARNKYNNAVASNIAGGPFGAASYMMNPAGGGFAGAAVDGVVTSFGGVPAGKSSAFPTSVNAFAAPSGKGSVTSYEHPPLNLTINTKPSWNNEQVTEAYNKAQAITTNPEAKVTIRNPAPRQSNLRNTYLKQGGTLKTGQHLDHITDLQINGTNTTSNLGGLNGSVNTSFGRQLNLQIQNVPDNTRVNTVSINPFTGKRN